MVVKSTNILKKFERNYSFSMSKTWLKKYILKCKTAQIQKGFIRNEWAEQFDIRSWVPQNVLKDKQTAVMWRLTIHTFSFLDKMQFFPLQVSPSSLKQQSHSEEKCWADCWPVNRRRNGTGIQVFPVTLFYSNSFFKTRAVINKICSSTAQKWQSKVTLSVSVLNKPWGNTSLPTI